MLDLLIAAAIVLGVNLLPAFGPPTWSVLVVLRLTQDIPVVPLVVAGAVAAAVGRLCLAAAAKRLRGRLSLGHRKSLDSLRARIEDNRRGAVAGLGLFALSPVPSAQLFIAAGLAGVRLVPVTTAFFAGRLVSYAIYVSAASAAGRSLGPTLLDAVRSPAGIAVELVMLGFLVALVRTDWTRMPGTRLGRQVLRLTTRNAPRMKGCTRQK